MDDDDYHFDDDDSTYEYSESDDDGYSFTSIDEEEISNLDDNNDAPLSFVGQLDVKGKYLLHFACQKGLPWYAMKRIVDGNINVVTLRDQNDEKCGLLPFMLASEGGDRNLTCAFELLRLRPDVLKMIGLDWCFFSVFYSSPAPGKTHTFTPHSCSYKSEDYHVLF